jgi:DNA-binding protein Fis
MPLVLITLDEVERRSVEHVLVATKNNKTEAARILGIDRRSLFRRLHENPAVTAAVADEELS